MARAARLRCVVAAALAVLSAGAVAVAQEPRPQPEPCPRYREITDLFLKGPTDLGRKLIDSDHRKGLSIEKSLRTIEGFSKETDDPSAIIGAALAIAKVHIGVDFCLDNIRQVFGSPKTVMPLGCGVMLTRSLPESGQVGEGADRVLLPVARGMYERAWDLVAKLADTDKNKRQVGIVFGTFRRCYR